MKKLLFTLLLLPTLVFGYNTLELNENNTISFNQAFSAAYVAQKQVEAINLCYKNKGSEINIALYSPGGSITAGQRLFDVLNALPCTFNTLTITSASMAYQTVQNLGKRFILPSGILMSHRASISGLSGEIGGELDSILSLIKTNVNEMEMVASKRVGLTLKQYQDLISDELWLTGSKAVKTGHADEVVFAKCDRSLMGTSIQTYYTFFGNFEVEFSNCPLVTAPLRVVRASRNNPIDLFNYHNNIRKHIYLSL